MRTASGFRRRHENPVLFSSRSSRPSRLIFSDKTMPKPSDPPPIKVDPRVLIVEDEPRMRELLVRSIGSWGFEVAEARSGEEALRLAGEHPPDIVLLDLNLPGIDGIEA